MSGTGIGPTSGAQGIAGPGEAPDFVRGDTRGPADVCLEALGTDASGALSFSIPGELAPFRGSRPVSPVPRSEARLHRFEALARALVGVGHDPLLAGRERRPTAVALTIEESRNRVAGDRPGQLGVSNTRQPLGRAFAVGESARRIVRR